MTPWDDAIAQWSLIRPACGCGTDTLPRRAVPDLPLKSGEKTYGLVVVEPGNLRQLMIPYTAAPARDVYADGTPMRLSG